MRAMDSFSSAQPRGLSDPASWFLYDLPMAAHAFVTYMLEMYLVMAAQLGSFGTVRDFFAGFARGDGDVFDLKKDYGIINVLEMLDDETCPDLDPETVEEQVEWVLALLDDLLHVPALVVIDVLPGSPGLEDLFVPSPQPPSASMTPLSALLTLAEVEVLLLTPTYDEGHLTPRRLF